MTTITGIFIYTLLHYPKVMAFGAGILAEELLLFLSFLSGHNLIDFKTVLIFGFLGAMVIDSIYYFIARSSFFKKYIENRMKSIRSIGLIKKIDKFANHNIFITLFLSKFIYGPRTIVILNFASNGMKYRKFLYNDVLAMLLWYILLPPLAWAAGHGLISSYGAVKEIEKTIGIAILFMIAIYFITEHIALRVIRVKKKK